MLFTPKCKVNLSIIDDRFTNNTASLLTKLAGREKWRTQFILKID